MLKARKEEAECYPKLKAWCGKLVNQLGDGNGLEAACSSFANNCDQLPPKKFIEPRVTDL